MEGFLSFGPPGLVHLLSPKSYAALLNALKSGHLKKGRHFHRYTDSEIDQLRMSPKFKDNYDKWLMKVFHPAAVMKQNLVEWFNKYKVNATDPVNNPGAGKRDPKTNKTLFTMDTKSTLMLQLQHCERIIDVCPLKSPRRRRPSISWLSIFLFGVNPS